MVATGALGTFLTQAALNAGQLIAAQPGLTLSPGRHAGGAHAGREASTHCPQF